MNSIINYFYNTPQKVTHESTPQPPPIPDKSTKPLKTKKQNTVYVVLNKSNQVLGVFDTLELAKSNGKMSTYHNCIVYEFTVNQKCTFLSNPIFEDN